MATYPTFGDSFFRNYVGAYSDIGKQLEDQRVAALRWQGARDYQTLVQSGIDPREALTRTAPKLFFNDPRALAATVPSMLSQQGGFVERNGQLFTLDRWGVPHPVHQPTGYRTLYDESGQKFVVPFTAGQPGGAQIPAQMGTAQPQMFTPPGTQSPYMLWPNMRAQRVQQDPKVQAYNLAEFEKRKLEAENILEKYKAAEANVEAGQKQFGWDKWMPFVEPYANQKDRYRKELEQLGFDTQLRVLPGTRLGQSLQGMQLPGLEWAPPTGLPGSGAAYPPGFTGPVAPGNIQYTAPVESALRQQGTMAPQSQRTGPPGPDERVGKTPGGVRVIVNIKTGARRPYAE
jgi:hypothetical protein